MNLQQAYELMYHELLSNRLEVSKEVGTDLERFETNGCGIRAVIGKNPEWYSELCRQYPRPGSSKRKKIRTIIKRRNTLKLLERLKQGYSSQSKYVPYLKDIAEQIIKDSKLTDENLNFFIEFGELPKPFMEQF